MKQLGWSEIHDQTMYEAALKLARGSYQIDLLRGYESMSGSTLKGKAAVYRGRYAQSRRALLERCRKAGICLSVVKREHGKLVLVIGLK
jgi:hypothetical protein